MKNIMIVDGAENCVYDIFAVAGDDFGLIFPSGTDVAFIEDIERRPNAESVLEALKTAWSHRIPKCEAVGIHGIVFYQLYAKRKYYQPCAMRKLSIPTVRLSVSHAVARWPSGRLDSH